MAAKTIIDLPARIKQLLPSRKINALADQVGARQRQRKLHYPALIQVLTFGFASARFRTFAAIHRAYQEQAPKDCRLSYKALRDHLTENLFELLKAALDSVLSSTREAELDLQGPLAQFEDLYLTDSAVCKLHALLEDRFPACRTNSCKAALKLHAVYSVRKHSLESVTITGERRCDGKVLKVGPWVKGALIEFDLGYYDFNLFARIDDNKGYFNSRLKSGANPIVVGETSPGKSSPGNLAGQKLKKVLPLYESAGEVDLRVQVRYQARVYRGQKSWKSKVFRLVGVRDTENGEWHLYLTNVPQSKLSAKEVAALYRARWIVELLFEEISAGYHLRDLASGSEELVKTLLWSSLLTLLVSRELWKAVIAASEEGWERRPPKLWWRVFAEFAGRVLVLLKRNCPKFLKEAWQRTLLAASLNAHRSRPGLLEQVEQGEISHPESAQYFRGKKRNSA